MSVCNNQRLMAALAEQFPQSDVVEALDEVTVTVEASRWPEAALTLRDHADFRFTQLLDVCGVDYLSYGHADWNTRSATHRGYSRAVASNAVAHAQPFAERFASVYHLLSLEHNERLRVRVFVPGEPPMVSSVVDVWASANWYEREAFDLFGILYMGHPDLRRLLTDYGFIGHPFRKDFPLEGNVEVRYDPEQRRVVYQPVSIENRVLVPRVIREDAPIGAASREGEGHA